MTSQEAVSIGELTRKVDALVAKLDTMASDVTGLKVDLAALSARYHAGLAVVAFLGSIVGGVGAWIAAFHRP